MLGLPIETIATIASIVFLSITQIILIWKGRITDAMKLEQKKEKQINKLTARRNKYINRAEKENNKIKEIEDNVTSIKTKSNNS